MSAPHVREPASARYNRHMAEAERLLRAAERQALKAAIHGATARHGREAETIAEQIAEVAQRASEA